MSNPAVITLADAKRGIAGLHRLQIEDNIGEAIHLHLGPIRLDFTIAEFLAVAEGMKKALDSTGRFFPYRVEQFDPLFLMECGSLLAHLEGIDIREKAIDDLRCIVYRSLRSGIYTVRPVTQIPAYRFLVTGDEKFLSYEQNGYLTMNNKDRLLKLAAEIETNGYPHNGKHVILFKGQNLIRDGQHRLAALRFQQGNVKIPVMIFRFSRKATMPLIPLRPYAGFFFRFGKVIFRRLSSRYRSLVDR